MGKYIINRMYNGIMLIVIVLQVGMLIYLEGSYGSNSDMSGYELFLLYMNSTYNIIFLGLSFVIAMGFPQRTGYENIIARTGLKMWLKYEIVSYMISVFVLELVVLITAFMISMSFSLKWSDDFFLCSFSCYEEFGSKLAGSVYLTNFVVFSNPVVSTLVCFVSHWLLACACGLCSITLNQNKKNALGIIIPLGLIKLPAFISVLGYSYNKPQIINICNFIDIMNNANLGNMKLHGLGFNVTSMQYYAMVILIIFGLTEAILIRRRKCLN